MIGYGKARSLFNKNETRRMWENHNKNYSELAALHVLVVFYHPQGFFSSTAAVS
jgi:hypothetical protein